MKLCSTRPALGQAGACRDRPRQPGRDSVCAGPDGRAGALDAPLRGQAHAGCRHAVTPDGRPRGVDSQSRPVAWPVWPRLSKDHSCRSDLQLSAIEALGDFTLPPNVTLRVAKAGELEPVNGGFQVGARGRGVLRTGVYRHSPQPGMVTVQDELHGEVEAVRLAKRELDLANEQTALAVPYTAGNRHGWLARTSPLRAGTPAGR